MAERPNDSVSPEDQVKLEESDIATLCNELTGISDWFMLGLNLGVPYRLLKEIRSNYSVEGCGACRRETLVLWLQRAPNASWRDVVGALRKMEEDSLAGRIERKYILACLPTSPASSSLSQSLPISPGLPISLVPLTSPGLPISPVPLTSPASSLSQSLPISPGLPISPVPLTSPIRSKSDNFACENLEAIKFKFANFQRKVCTKLSKNEVDIDQVLLFAKSRFSPGDFIPQPPTTLNKIFDSITGHGLWNFFHFTPLVEIAETFGEGDSDIETWIQSYEKDFKSFLIVTEIKDLIELDDHMLDTCTEPPPAKRAKYDPRCCRRMEWKTDFVDHTLLYLTYVWKKFSSHYLEPNSPPTALLDRVREGCVSVTWLIPSYLVPQLIKRVKIDAEFFQVYRIMKVTVDDQCIYEEETSKESTPNRSSDSEGEGGADDYSGTSPHATHQNEDIPPEIPAYKHGYECKIIDPPAWVEALQTTCPICLQVLRDPQQTICGHTFCEICIKKAQASQKQTCPECKKSKVSTFPHESLRRLLSDLQVQCTSQDKEGMCDWTGKLRELDNHLNLSPTAPDVLQTGCKFVNLQCEFSYAGCEAEMSRKDMAIHMQEEQSYHIQLLDNKVSKQDRKIKGQSRQIEKLTVKLRTKEEETACAIQQMQQEFTLQLQSKDEEIANVTHKMKEISALLQSKDKEIAQLKQDTKPTPHLHQVNFYFKMDKFKHHRENEITWYSEPFYTYSQGYRICVRIDASGFRDSNFVSLFTCIMKGEYDDELSWPFHGKISIELLNQKTDDHHVYTISYDESAGPKYLKNASQVLIGKQHYGLGSSQFMSYHKISQNSPTVQYLADDCLRFRVSEVLLYS